MSAGIIAVKSTLLGNQKPETNDERDKRIAKSIAEWPKRMVAGLTAEQRQEAKKLLTKKNKTRKSNGRPPWSPEELRQFRLFYLHFREQGLGYEGSMEELALIYARKAKTLKRVLTKANRLEHPINPRKK